MCERFACLVDFMRFAYSVAFVFASFGRSLRLLPQRFTQSFALTFNGDEIETFKWHRHCPNSGWMPPISFLFCSMKLHCVTQSKWISNHSQFLRISDLKIFEKIYESTIPMSWTFIEVFARFVWPITCNCNWLQLRNTCSQSLSGIGIGMLWLGDTFLLYFIKSYLHLIWSCIQIIENNQTNYIYTKDS